MGNFFKDNEDLQYYVSEGIDWKPLVELTEYLFRAEEGFKTPGEAVEFYSDILDLVGEFSAEQIFPHRMEIDAAGVRFEGGEAIFPERMQAIFDAIREMELHGMCLPRELGGQNAPLLIYFLAAEMIGRGDISVMTHHSFHGGMAMAMLAYSVREGTTEFDLENARITKTRFAKEIEEIRTGAAWGCMDITEPDAGSDMAALRAVGEQDADGNWFVTGTKIFITSGHGKYHFVIARTEDAGSPDDPMAGLKGLSMFLVPTYVEHEDGRRERIVTIDRLEEKVGHHGSATCTLSFERAPAQLIGQRGEGFKYMLTLMNNARLGVGFESLGLCEAANRLAVAYAAQRESMGKTIDRHEMIFDLLDEMDVDVRAVRALNVEGAWYEEMARKTEILLDTGVIKDAAERASKEKELSRYRRRARRLTPLVKWFASEKAVQICRRAMQIHGGVGYIEEYGVGKLLRDSLAMPIYEGTSQIQSLMATKDTLNGILANPKAFMRGLAQANLKALSSADPNERRVARLQRLSYGAQRHLITRTATDKFATLKGRPFGQWGEELKAEKWDMKKDFAYAMLHAEHLTELLTYVALAEIFMEQARKHPHRQALFERFMERAEPLCRHLSHLITDTGDGLLSRLMAKESEADRAAS